MHLRCTGWSRLSQILGAWKSVSLKSNLAYPVIFSLVYMEKLPWQKSGLTDVRLKWDPTVIVFSKQNTVFTLSVRWTTCTTEFKTTKKAAEEERNDGKNCIYTAIYETWRVNKCYVKNVSWILWMYQIYTTTGQMQ